MDQSMQHFNQYQTNSAFDWQGLKSNRFPKMRYMHPNKDIIKTGLDIPNQTCLSGRKHFETQRSSEYSFKPRNRMYKDIHHWIPKPAGKKVLDLQYTQPTQPHPRYQKGHFHEPIFEHTDKQAGIRTFYNKRLRNDQREYSVEDRMQRKVRTDQYSLRKQAFKNQSLGMTQKFPKVRY